MNIWDQTDTDSDGEMRALMDEIAEKGIAPTVARSFVTWLEADRLALAEQVVELKEKLEDYEPEVRHGTRYHKDKNDAIALMRNLLEDPRVAAADVQFEPYNGWLVVVLPAPMALPDLAEIAEVRNGLPKTPDPAKVRPKPIADAAGRAPTAPSPASGGKAPAQPGAAPTKGVTAQVWEIADGIGNDRAKIIAACVERGINQATAATQYSKWKKAKGY